jgi:hypothetical protein
MLSFTNEFDDRPLSTYESEKNCKHQELDTTIDNMMKDEKAIWTKKICESKTLFPVPQPLRSEGSFIFEIING